MTLDGKAGKIVSDAERGVCIKQATDALFSELVASGLDIDTAYVQRHKALKAARTRHKALHRGLADLVEAGKLLDGAVDALLARMQDFDQRVSAVRAMAEADMGGSSLHGWRDTLIARLVNGSGARVAGWVPAYKSLRDGSFAESRSERKVNHEHQ